MKFWNQHIGTLDNTPSVPCISLIKVSGRELTPPHPKPAISAFFLARAKAKSTGVCDKDNIRLDQEEGIDNFFKF